MKCIVISDTHGMYKDVDIPDGDVLIHCGDVTAYGKLAELEEFNTWLDTLPHKHKIIIAGNHDWCFQDNEVASRAILTNGIYLQDESITLEGINFYGSPWQPEFCNWAFNLPRGEALKAKWDMIPDNTDVLITHSPPKGILDECPDGFEAGCEELRRAVFKVQPQVHCFGHIHHSYGEQHSIGTHFINTAICTERYLPYNPPTEFEIKRGEE